MRVALGVDPDTKCSGFAIVSDEPKVLAIGCIDTSKFNLRGTDAVSVQAPALFRAIMNCPFEVDVAAVEGQQVYQQGRADANNLILLANVSGAAMVAAYQKCENVLLPRPREWKGQLPKGISQRRVCDEIGWGYEFRGKKDPVKVTSTTEVQVAFPVPESHMKEVVDAIGLALWALKQ